MQILTFEKGRHPFKPPPTKLQKTSSYLCLVSSLPPSLRVPKPTLHTTRGRDHLLWLPAAKSPPCSSPLLPSRTCSAQTPLHFTPVSISRWMLFLLCCSDASAQGSPSAYSTRFSMHAQQLQQQHLIELLHAARSAAFYIKQTYFCRSSIVTWQNLERFPSASPGYSFVPPPQPVCLTHRNRTSVAERAGRYSLYLQDVRPLLAHTDSTSLHFEPHVQNCILAVAFQGSFSHKCFPPLLSPFLPFSLMNSQKSSPALHKTWLHVFATLIPEPYSFFLSLLTGVLQAFREQLLSTTLHAHATSPLSCYFIPYTLCLIRQTAPCNKHRWPNQPRISILG